MPPIPEAGGERRARGLQALPFVLFAPFGVHYFETFANGWDQAEYAWCVQDGYLPHSPYVLFVLLGRLLGVFLEPAVALSTLSFGAGLLAIAGMVRLGGVVAATLLALSTVFVRQVTTQEAYALQLALALLAAWLATGGSRARPGLAGVAFGSALAAHSASLFLLPALLYRAWGPGGPRFLALALVTWAGSAAVVAALLPADYPLLAYLRGMPPGFDPASLASAGFVADALVGIFERLTDGGIAVTRGPLATGPVGASVLTLLAAGVGAVVCARREPPAAIFWLLWTAPFLLYELALGWNLDYGTYLVFPMPALCALAGAAVGRLRSLPAPSGAWLAAAATSVLVLPSVLQLVAHWEDAEIDRRRHDAPTTLAAAWARDALPAEAVLVQPRSEWNANLLPLHAGRRHVARSGGGLRLFRATGPGTPMKPEAYEPLTTERLAALLRAGTPVFAFEPDPLGGSDARSLDPAAFRWQPLAPVDVGGARSVTLYRAALAVAGSSR